MGQYAIYVALVGLTLFVAWRIWRHANAPAPAPAYFALMMFGGALILMALVDTEWLQKVRLQMGDQTYGVVGEQLAQVKRDLVAYESEIFTRADLEKRMFVDPPQADGQVPVRFVLNGPAVPESVLVWYGWKNTGETLQVAPPSRVVVNGNSIVLLSDGDPFRRYGSHEDWPFKAEVRYFRVPAPPKGP